MEINPGKSLHDVHVGGQVYNLHDVTWGVGGKNICYVTQFFL